MITDTLLDAALSSVQKDHSKLVELVARVQGTEVGEFVNRALDWRINKPQEFYELFCQVIDTSPEGFMGSFRMWVVNALLDDDSFEIKWFRSEMNRETRTFQTVSADPSDSDFSIYPLVVQGGDTGRQDPKLLMVAMDRIEENKRNREQYYKRFEMLMHQIKNL
jgi:hypothetical protein